MLVCGLALLAALLAQIGPERVASLLVALGGSLLAIAAIFTGHECVRAAAVSLCFPPGPRPHFRQLLRIRLLGEAAGALTRTGSFVAEPARAWMLASHAADGAHGVGAAAGELLANSCVSALVTVMALGWTTWRGVLHGPLFVLSQILLWASAGYISIVVAAIVTRTRVVGAIAGAAAALPRLGRRLSVNAIKIRQAEDATVRALTAHPAALGHVLLLELLAQSILVFEIYWTVRSMGLTMSGGTALQLEALTKAANVIQLIGVTEAGYALVLDWFGMTAAVGFALSLAKTLRSLVAAAVGLGVLAQIERRTQPCGFIYPVALQRRNRARLRRLSLRNLRGTVRQQ